MIADISKVLFDTEEFLLLTKDETDIKKPLKYLGVTVILGAFITYIIEMIKYLFTSNENLAYLQALASKLGGSIPVFLFIYSITYFILVFFTVLICSIIAHMSAKILKGRKGYNNSLKALCYGLTPIMFLKSIPYINILAGLWSLKMQSNALVKYQKITPAKSYIVLLLSEILPLVIIILFLFSIG